MVNDSARGVRGWIRGLRVAGGLVLLWHAGALPAQSTATPWSTDDVALRPRVSDFRFDAAGTRLFQLRTEADLRQDAFVAHLELYDLGMKTRRRLTFGEGGVDSYAVAADGSRLAFVATRSGGAAKSRPRSRASEDQDDAEPHPQVFVLPLSGGEAWRATDFPFGVVRVLRVDEASLLVLARDRKSPVEVAAEERKDRSEVVEDPERFAEAAVRLFRVDLGEEGEIGTAVRLTTNRDSISAAAVSPDGRQVVALHLTSPSYEAEGEPPPRVFLHDLERGAAHELFTDRKLKPESFAWTRDGRGFYAIAPRATVDGESMAVVRGVVEVDAETRVAADVPLAWERGIAEDGLAVTADGFVALLRDGVRHRPARFVRSGSTWVKEGLAGPDGVRIFEFVTAAGSERVAWVVGGASEPDTVKVGRLAGAQLVEAEVALRPDAGLDERTKAKTEVVTWTGAEGARLEGLLWYPHDWKEGTRAPLVVLPHGGPHAADLDRFEDDWAYPRNLHAQAGAFVFAPNYHGSEGYGLAFGESIRHRYYELEIEDVLSGVEALVERGLVDRERIAVGGWSNGAILAIACLTLADRFAPTRNFAFRACLAGAGDVDWSGDYGVCAFGAAFGEYYLGARPWEAPELFLSKSPLYHVEKVTTPTLIFFGDEDRAVPTAQGYQWFRALRRVGKAPVRFVLFPGQGHGLDKPSFRRRKVEEERAFLGKHLFQRPAAATTILETSPLAAALAAKDYARVGRLYGHEEAGWLVPEVVPLGAVSIGRFEVTRAQWRAAHPEIVIAAGEENHPITGIGPDEAKDYVRALREKTGRPWRLLSREEHAALPEGPRENTLETWAGHPLSPDAVAAVRAAVAELGDDGDLPPLLEAVGSRPPGTQRVGEALARFHDVLGNAGEWVLGPDGQAEIAGACAFSVDEKGPRGSLVPPAYRGLRVAIGVP